MNCATHESLSSSNTWVFCFGLLTTSLSHNQILKILNIEDSVDFSNFSVREYFPLIWRDSVVHDVTVYIKEGLSCVRDYSLKTLIIYIYVFSWLHFVQCLTSFYCINHHPFLCTVFDDISSKIDKIISVYLSTNAFVFWKFNVHYKALLTEKCKILRKNCSGTWNDSKLLGTLLEILSDINIRKRLVVNAITKLQHFF